MTQQPLSAFKIEIRHCTTITEYEEATQLGYAIWGEHVSVPSGVFVVAHHTGGQVFAAFDSARMIGFTLAIVGVRGGNSYLHSHLTAVLPEYRNSGIGRRLKLFQRDDALQRGFNLIEWTFDPLQIKNAYFNLVRLGAIVRRFIPNCYGITGSPLHGQLPTDRLVAEWWLNSDRVRAILAGNPLELTGSSERLALPADLAELKLHDETGIGRIQTEARSQFQRAFANGQAATSLNSSDGQIDYILEPASGIAGLKLPELGED